MVEISGIRHMTPSNLTEAYFRVADRALDAADAVVAEQIQEKGGFLAYHSLESCGGAYCNARGIHFPRSHQGKIRQFISGIKRERFARQAAQLATEVESLRNAFLYPRPLHGVIHMPEDAITVAQARRLTARLRTLKTRIQAAVQ
jgi:hypothetical protein